VRPQPPARPDPAVLARRLQILARFLEEQGLAGLSIAAQNIAVDVRRLAERRSTRRAH